MEGYNREFNVNNYLPWNNQQNCMQNIPSEGFISVPPPPPPPNFTQSKFMNCDQRSSHSSGGENSCLQFPLPPVVQTTENATLLSNAVYCGPKVNVNVQQCPPISYQQEHQFPLNQPPALPFMMYNIPLNTIPQQTDLISSYQDLTSKEDASSIVDCNNDEKWINDWLKKIRKFNSNNLMQKQNKETTSSGEVKIYELKEKVSEIKKLLWELEISSKSLSVMYKSLDDSEWKSRCCEIEEKKKKLSDLLGLLVNNKDLLIELKKKLQKRKKKRQRQKRKRQEWKEEKIENSVRRQQLHQSIDKWLEDMQDTVERGRREEELKREADSVLSDVTRKKTEAKRQIALLSGLLKLRQARITTLTATGKNISQQQTEAFNSVIERLKSLWENQLKDYLLEEQGLKVMLNEAAAEEKNSEDLRRKEALHEWEIALFGSIKCSEYQPRDINELISLRKQWDQFVVDEGTIMSSSIPTGWVIPVKASNSDWMKFNELNSN